MPLFYKKLLLTLFAVFLLIMVMPIINTNDNHTTHITYQVIYSLDFKQPSLNGLSLRDAFQYNVPLDESITQDTIDFWYSVYLKLI